ncbi:MAG TPA: hypothetical protein PLH52_09830 [Paludibacteraceae bacterium]|nr:hypothetical protein [Paludibacteraceae bacterium]
MRAHYLFLILFLSIFAASCEYPFSNDNFVDIEPPSGNKIFQLNLIPQGDTIYVYKPTTLKIDINSFGLEVRYATIEIGGSVHKYNYGEGSISLYPWSYPPGAYELKLSIVTRSGSGSIADYFGAEGYMAERKWTIVIDNEEPKPLKITKSITPEGFLKLSWDKPKHYRFSAYQLQCNGGYSKQQTVTITDINQNFYVDSTYFGGNGACSVVVRTKDNDFISRSSLSYNDSFPDPKLEAEGFDSLRFHWTPSPYKANYAFQDNSGNLIYKTSNDSSFALAHPGFGNRVEFYFFFGAYNNPSLTFTNSYSKYYSYEFGNWLVNNWPEFGYNLIDKTLYTNEYNYVLAYDVMSVKEINRFFLKDLVHDAKYACPISTTQLAVQSFGFISVFEDKKLGSPLKIPYNSSSHYLFFAENGKIGSASFNKFDVFDAYTGKLDISIHISDYPYYAFNPKMYSFAMSGDGKYFCVAANSGFQMYRIADGSLIYKNSNPYTSVLFDIENPSVIYLSPSDSKFIEVRNAEDFSLIKKIETSGTLNMLQNIDPETNNLLITDYKKMYVYDLANAKFVFSIGTNSVNTNPKLFNNIIFGSNGYYLQISNYLEI